MTRSAKLAIAAAALCVAVTPTAHAAKPAPSGSTAPAQVFFPNPVQSLRDETLTDQKDANYPALAAAYERKTLTDLDGSGTLTGAYAKVESETGTPARNTGSGFIYTRDQDQFEQVMAYYWVTQAQRYIQSLGFGTTLPAVNKRQQLVRINQFGGDNSFYRNGTKKLTITYGKGGVDDAEDAEVIVHEYGHSVQDDQVRLRSRSRRSIGEAFGDYLAVTSRRSDPAWPTGTRPRTRPARCTACAGSTAPSTTRRTSRARCTRTASCGRVRCGGHVRSSATRPSPTG